MKVTVQQGQNLMDIAIQRLGDMMGLYDLADINGLSVTDRLQPGTELELPLVVNQGAANYFANKQVIVSTELSEAESRRPGGIGFMKIGYDFKVS